jgi:molecular chaperone GrpE (heat shock protein)
MELDQTSIPQHQLQTTNSELKLRQRIAELEEQCERLKQDKARQQRIMCEVKKTQEQTNIRFE